MMFNGNQLISWINIESLMIFDSSWFLSNELCYFYHWYPFSRRPHVLYPRYNFLECQYEWLHVGKKILKTQDFRLFFSKYNFLTKLFVFILSFNFNQPPKPTQCFIMTSRWVRIHSDCVILKKIADGISSVY